MQISTIGIDLAKTVFQIDAVDADGTTVIRKRLRRAEVLSSLAGLEPCRIGMEPARHRIIGRANSQSSGTP